VLSEGDVERDDGRLGVAQLFLPLPAHVLDLHLLRVELSLKDISAVDSDWTMEARKLRATCSGPSSNEGGRRGRP